MSWYVPHGVTFLRGERRTTGLKPDFKEANLGFIV